MGKKKSIQCQGQNYDSVLELSAVFSVAPSLVARRLRSGWTPEQAIGLDSKPQRRGHGIPVSYRGKEYPHLEALAETLGIDGKTFRARLARGYSLEDAASGNKRPRKSAVAESIAFEGTTYPSKESLAKAHGLRWGVVVRRLQRGWSMCEALGVDEAPPRFRDFEGHARSVKWKQARQTEHGVEPIPDTDGYKLYLITNSVNRKQYVGLTIGSLADRLKQHFSAARRGRKAPLPNAIRKHGQEAFSIELIRNDARSYEELQDQEINEIALRNTITHGYNSAVGGSLGTSKSITVDGKLFPSRAQAAEHYGIDTAVFNLRITRLKWSPEEAAGMFERHWAGKNVPVTVQGVEYPSIRQVAIAFDKDFRKIYDRYSEKGWTLEQALDLEPPPETTRFTGIQVSAFGVTFSSIAQAACAHRINPESLRRRLVRGESVESAIKAAIAKKRKAPLA